MNKVFIIAEAGVNHNGDEKLAFQLVDAAIDAGADAVKFQTFKADNIVTASASKAEYQKSTTGENESQLSMIKKLELPFSSYSKLMDYCNQNNILFMSTAFDHDSLRFLIDSLEVDILKIPSGEITNGPLLLAHAQAGKKILLSTGMSTLGEVEEALGVIAFGFLNPDSEPRCPKKNFQMAYSSPEGQKLLRERVTLLHCTTEYPAPLKSINLKAMLAMEKAFGLKVGYSDHSEGIVIPIVAASLGACVVEKHFTLSKSLSGPDHKASLDPAELRDMVVSIRMAEKVMGSGIKMPAESELKNRYVTRRCLVAIDAINKGNMFTKLNVGAKRPGKGISPMQYWDVLGAESQHEYKYDDLLNE